MAQTTLDKLYLELSELTTVKTKRELALAELIRKTQESKSQDAMSSMAHLAHCCCIGRLPGSFIYDDLDQGFVRSHLDAFKIEWRIK